MKLLLMRHGDAEPNAKTDSDRSLTPFGRGCVKSLIHPTNRVCMYLSRHPDRSPQAFFADIVG